MNINNIYYEQLTDENWHDARAVYAFLPKLDDDEIKPLIKSDDEINTFISEQNAIPDGYGYTLDALEAFLGEEFLIATRQPQHLLLTREEAIKERLYYFYDDLASAWYKYDLRMTYNREEPHFLQATLRRQEYISTHTRERTQLEQELLLSGKSEIDYWIDYDISYRDNSEVLRYRYIHTQRNLPDNDARDTNYNGSLLERYRERYLNYYEMYRRELSMYGMM